MSRFESMTDDQLHELLDKDPPAYGRLLLERMREGAEEAPDCHAAKVRKAILSLTLEEKLDFLITAFVPMMMAQGEAILAQAEAMEEMETRGNA